MNMPMIYTRKVVNWRLITLLEGSVQAKGWINVLELQKCLTFE